MKTLHLLLLSTHKKTMKYALPMLKSYFFLRQRGLSAAPGLPVPHCTTLTRNDSASGTIWHFLKLYGLSFCLGQGQDERAMTRARLWFDQWQLSHNYGHNWPGELVAARGRLLTKTRVLLVLSISADFMLNNESLEIVGIAGQRHKDKYMKAWSPVFCPCKMGSN